jgi:uncharacterized membrane protein
MTTTVPSAAPSRTTTDTRLRIAIAVLSVIGIGIGAYLTYVHYEKIKVLCLSSGGCETVQSSSYAKLAGIPVATLGLAGYIGIFLSVWIRNELGRLGAFGLALLGFLFSMYLTYRELFTIKAICQWCVGSAVLMTLLAILTTIRVVRDEPAAAPPAVNGHKTVPRAERRRQMAKARR